MHQTHQILLESIYDRCLFLGDGLRLLFHEILTNGLHNSKVVFGGCYELVPLFRRRLADQGYNNQKNIGDGLRLLFHDILNYVCLTY